MIGKIICGVLSDKISPNLLFSSGLFLSGVFTLLFSQTDNFYLFVLFWFLNGLVQGEFWVYLDAGTEFENKFEVITSN